MMLSLMGHVTSCRTRPPAGFNREGVVLLEVVESDEGESGWKIPPKNMERRARILGGVNNMNRRGVEREGGGNMNLNYDQGVMMDSRTPLKIMECTNKERGSSETCI